MYVNPSMTCSPKQMNGFMYSMYFYIPNTPCNMSNVWLKSHKLPRYWRPAIHQLAELIFRVLQMDQPGVLLPSADMISMRKPIMEPILSFSYLRAWLSHTIFPDLDDLSLRLEYSNLLLHNTEEIYV